MDQMNATMNLAMTFQMSLDSFMKDNKTSTVNENDEKLQQALTHLEKINFFRSWDKKKEIALQALRMDSNCMEAYLVLGMYTKDHYAKLDILKRGMEKATIHLGKDFFLQDVKDFYVFEHAHSFFQIKFAYALSLFECGYMKKAMGQFKELLNLNPSDHFKAHEFLYVLYLYFEDLSLCKELMNKYQDRNTLYVYVLFLYEMKRQNYDNAKKIISLMKKSNAHLFAIITNRKMNMIIAVPNYEQGSEEEASYVFHMLSRLFMLQEGIASFIMQNEE
ncbi:MAG: hypothetical protein EOM50_04480 [Erysipelotrichia bacterium]|nr:hypothetical protein [Erysipelotrichia bacterium]NCC54038.1 hypothetical protein [Erysipelotrichia bacterium]